MYVQHIEIKREHNMIMNTTDFNTMYFYKIDLVVLAASSDPTSTSLAISAAILVIARDREKETALPLAIYPPYITRPTCHCPARSHQLLSSSSPLSSRGPHVADGIPVPLAKWGLRGSSHR